ncbi:cellobiohydrolase I [Pholiota molesta]|nr:cellobiohydrolase I [Pholiota molesta]
MFNKAALIAFSLIAMACGQQVGTLTAETHPTLPWQTCTTAGGCTTQSTGKVVLDSNWRWLHSTTGSTNCYTGNTWDATLCPDGTTCASNCALDGADYEGTYGITASGNALTLKFVTTSAQTNVGSRVYLMASDTSYEMFKLLNQEFSFDVDVSNLPCGLNGALYFSQMDADGGMAKFPTNKAGAKYGTGYCDSQCPRDIKFINGVANSVGWDASANDANAGTGQYGTCCNEMDVGRPTTTLLPSPLTLARSAARPAATALPTMLAVPPTDLLRRWHDRRHYPEFTVVTQFLTDDGTATGTLSEIRRIYVQNGVVIQNSNVNIPGMSSSYNSITDQYCTDQKTAFGDTTSFQDKGASRTCPWPWPAEWCSSSPFGMTTPSTCSGSTPTTPPPPRPPPWCCRGLVPPPPVFLPIETSDANASVTYSNIKFGDINSTFTGTGGTGTTGPTTTAGPTPTTTNPAPAATQSKYGQCGGIGYNGPTVCASGSSCQESNTYYSQCL